MDDCSQYSEEYEYQYSDDEDSTASMGVDFDRDEEISSEGEGGMSGRLALKSEGDTSTLKRRKLVGAVVTKSALKYGEDASPVTMVDSREILIHMNGLVNEVAEVLNITATAATALLRNHKWNKEVLYEAYMSNESEIKERSGVAERCKCSPTHDENRSYPDKRPRTCSICFDDDLESHEMLGMPCGHEFCLDCWRGFITSAVQDGPMCIRTTCPQAECNEVVTEDEIRLISNIEDTSTEDKHASLLHKYQSFQLRNFIQMSGDYRWCPGAGCNRVATLSLNLPGQKSSFQLSDNVIARCDACPSIFCIKCGEEPHSPLSCRALKDWNGMCEKIEEIKGKRDRMEALKIERLKEGSREAQRALTEKRANSLTDIEVNEVKKKLGYSIGMSADSESSKKTAATSTTSPRDTAVNGSSSESETTDTIRTLLLTSKECPNCSVRIEKNMGCNHMSCRHCGHQFCWVCLAQCGSHSSQRCSQIQAKKNEEDKIWKETWILAKGSGFPKLQDLKKKLDDLNIFLRCYFLYKEHDTAQKRLKEELASCVSFEKNTKTDMKKDACVNTEYIRDAKEQLIICQRAVKYSHSFAYNLAMVPTNGMNEEERGMTKLKEVRFNDHQTTLIRLMDGLSSRLKKIVETDVNLEDGEGSDSNSLSDIDEGVLSDKVLSDYDYRMNVMNQTKAVITFMKNTRGLQCVEDGINA